MEASPNDNILDTYINTINGKFGFNILCIYNDTITLDCKTFGKIFEKYSIEFIKNEFHNNLFLQLSLTKVIQDRINNTSTALTDYLAPRIGISKNDFQKIINLSNLSPKKSRVDVAGMINGVINDLVRTQLEAILSPIQTNIITVLNQVYNFIMQFYVSDSSNSLLNTFAVVINEIVIQLAGYVTLAENFVNRTFNNLIYNNDTTSAVSTTVSV